MTIVTGGPGAVYTSGAPEFTPDLVGFVSFFAWLLCCLSLFDLRIFFITHLAFSSYSSTYISKPSDWKYYFSRVEIQKELSYKVEV